MIVASVVLLILAALCDIIKMSMMSRIFAYSMCVCWGIIAAIITYQSCTVSSNDISFRIYGKDIIIAVFLESFVFIGFCFAEKRLNNILKYYPGLVIALPLIPLASECLRLFPGKDFTMLSIAVGISTGIILILLTALARYLYAGKDALYQCALISFFIGIIIYGMI